jgi:hypothetical protein
MRNLPRQSARACALAVAFMLAVVAPRGQEVIALASLTVPSNQLPQGCSLPPSDKVPSADNGFRLGLWAGLPITSNPWRGDKPSVVAAIREHVADSPPLPDGPPLTRAELSRFRQQLADDVAEAYAAIYRGDEPGSTIVYAVRFKSGPVPAPPSGSRNSLRIVRGDTVVVVSGTGPCFEAVAIHVREQTAR